MIQTNIVQINVSQTLAPTPNKLQQLGAILSQGATTTAANTATLLSQKADLTAILAGATAISAMSYSAGTVSVTTAAPHGLTSGEDGTVAGVTPTGYNGTFELTVTGASTFTYALGSNPGVVTVQGTVTDEDVSQVVAAVNTFFSQGSNAAVYVLELGHGTPAQGVTALSTYIDNNPKAFYDYLVPRQWDEESTFKDLTEDFEALDAQIYFYVTAQLSTYDDFTAKSVYKLIESPDIPSTEFTIAGDMYWILSQKPSSTNKVPPSAFSYRIGVTTYPFSSPTQQTLFQANNVNYITTGAEGGISNKMVVFGKMADGRPANYWYSVDNTQIELQQNIANEIFNGSNTSINPLYYDQAGINRLQNRAVKTMYGQVQRGLALGKVIATQLDQQEFIDNLNAGKYAGNIVVNAVPFAAYTAANPTHYALGEYDGLTAVYAPARGFEKIIFNLNVTDFVG